jgi:hypothetical protein
VPIAVTARLPTTGWAVSFRHRFPSVSRHPDFKTSVAAAGVVPLRQSAESHPEFVNHPETAKLIASVEEVSGYRVTIDTIDGIQENAQMISARPGNPFHLIRVNTAHRRYADYIVAVQCGMLLVMWSDPSKVPELVPDRAKCDYWGKRWSGSKPMASLPPESALRMANLYLQGLIQQLHSLPMEIRVARLCFESCPGLREMQHELLTAHLRQLSEIFSPKIRQQLPQELFEKGAAMNAALAKAWGELAESRLPVIPYEATGYLEKGENLLAVIDTLPENTSENHVMTVDSWAEQLGMGSLFGWKYTNRIQ